MGVAVDHLEAIAAEWRAQRGERFARRHLDPTDFARLRDAGLTSLPVPISQGGSWVDVSTSVRPICDALRVLAAADPSPALVSAMHPAVLSFWLANEPNGTDEGRAWDAWALQCREVCATAASGAQWGTVTSEPGSGGDVARTRSTAAPCDGSDDVEVSGRRYLLSGDKHFGSGTGICAFMLTTAIPDGEDQPAAFFLDTRELIAGRDQPGFTVTREWDGVGMAATQSHAVRLDGCRAIRLEFPGTLEAMVRVAGPVNMCLFAAVVLGVLDEAMAAATERVGPRIDELRPFEQVEWARATTDHWLAEQAFEGMLSALESGDENNARRAALRGKTAIAELTEQALLRATRVVGGGTFSASSPFAAWFQDVRALGFLRPPWGLAVDGIIATSV